MTNFKSHALRHSIELMMETFDQIGDSVQEEYGYFTQRALHLLLSEADPDIAYEELRTIFCTEVGRHMENARFFFPEVEHRIRKNLHLIENTSTLKGSTTSTV